MFEIWEDGKIHSPLIWNSGGIKQGWKSKLSRFDTLDLPA